MTIYYPDGRNKPPVTIKRDGAQKHFEWCLAEAVRCQTAHPNNDEWELGLTTEDIRASVPHLRKEAERMRGVIAAIDAGAPELPAHLYPLGLRQHA